MASGFYRLFKNGLLRSVFNFQSGGHTVKVALMGAGYTYAITHRLWGDTGVSENEVTATGYTAGGAVVTCSLTVDSTSAMVLTAGDITWNSADISTIGAILYDDTVGNKPLIAWLDFGETCTSDHGEFTLSWTDSDNVIFTLT